VNPWMTRTPVSSPSDDQGSAPGTTVIVGPFVRLRGRRRRCD
jgi:hypothetical protein